MVLEVAEAFYRSASASSSMARSGSRQGPRNAAGTHKRPPCQPALRFSPIGSITPFCRTANVALVEAEVWEPERTADGLRKRPQASRRVSRAEEVETDPEFTQASVLANIKEARQSVE